MLDKTDKAILRLLQQNARMPNAEIARKIKLAPSAVLKRIQRMEQEKIITGYEAKIDPRALGLGMGSFIKIHADEKLGEVAVGKKIRKPMCRWCASSANSESGTARRS